MLGRMRFFDELFAGVSLSITSLALPFRSARGGVYSGLTFDFD